MKNLLTLTFILFSCTLIFTQQVVWNEIENAQRNGVHFSKTNFLQYETDDIHHRDLKMQGLKQGIILNLDTKAINQLLYTGDETINLTLPTSERSSVNILLKKNEIFTPDFKLFTSSNPQTAINYIPGLHYNGIVEGDPNSIVALSVFSGQIMAMIATDEGNFTIGQIKDDKERRHIFYNDKELDKRSGFECGTEDDGLGYSDEQLSPNQNSRDEFDCIRVHVEVDDDIVTAKGGVLPATDYITAIFNQSFTLFANDNISLMLSEIFAWSTSSPYTGSNRSIMLSQFCANTEFFNGDISHLVSFDSVYGGQANSFNGICNAYPDQSKCFLGMINHFESVPIYSMNVFGVSHEMGHLLGSRHTHACVWNGNNTAIDGCAESVEGSCPIPPLPPNGGTIMSYCNPEQNVWWVNFNEGFGPQPGDVIRNKINAPANCLSPCGQPTEYCLSNGISSSGEWIDKIVLGSINNNSGNNGGYGNYTSLSTTLISGNTYTITLAPKFSGGHHQVSWRVWIDYNHDYDWYDSGELLGQTFGSNTRTLTFTVPTSTLNVTTRMRVSMRYGGYPFFCGTHSFGEVEDYFVVISGAPEPTCSDGTQNQGETGVDCGGPCPACLPAPTCSDGLQNQNETGIDCGGVCQACNVENGTVLLASYFETGWDSWVDGGADVARVNSSNSYEGSYSIRLADNSGTQSAMTSPPLNLLSAVGVEINFHFYPTSMETGDDFWLRYNNGSGNWITVANFISGTNFVNNQFYVANVTIPDFIPTSAGSFRIQCDAGEKNDQVYIDAVTITKLNGLELIEPGISIQKLSNNPEVLKVPEDVKLRVYPNPVKDVLHISINGAIQSIRLMSLEGTEQKADVYDSEENQIHIQHLAPGLYFLLVQSGNRWYPVKFSKV